MFHHKIFLYNYGNITKLFKKTEILNGLLNVKLLKKTSRTSTFKLPYSLILTRNYNFMFILTHFN
jgi:hypothetical protein